MVAQLPQRVLPARLALRQHQHQRLALPVPRQHQQHQQQLQRLLQQQLQRQQQQQQLQLRRPRRQHPQQRQQRPALLVHRQHRRPQHQVRTTTTTTSTTSATTSTTTTTTTSTAAPTTWPYTATTVTCSSTSATSCSTTTTLVASCQSYEVSWNNRCYYLDGSGGACASGYTLGTNAVLTCIATQFVGKTYRSVTSSNCCIWTADTYECYGMSSNCNSAGTFSVGPVVNGAGCANAQNHNSGQLTFCSKV
ncbi:unnamed protein product [Rotaria magnacalcarata]|uniref:Uncharacterized protein n=1 Tax=Rotaria magnacalcarata TaxID=392030 RepID=A0A815QAD5_9BILA|nr:unnamed protein product [Rotaria magnacalcarata]